MLLTFIAVYLFINLLIGWWASKRISNTEDFVLAGRGLSFMFSSMVTFATWFGSETMMGAPAEFIKDGFLGVIEEPFGASLCLVLVGCFYARIFYKLNILTFCDYFGLRFGKIAEYASAILMIPSYFGWIAAQLVAMGVVMQVIIGLPLSTGIWISALLVMTYTLMGGMWSISITDFLHNILLILGLIILGVILYRRIGGIENIIAQTPPGFFRIIPKDFTLKSNLEYFAAWITVGLGSIPQQDIFQRVMASKDEHTAVKSSITAGIMYLTIAMLPLFIALIAKILHPELLNADTKMIIPNMVLQHTSPFIQIVFFGALISAILSTTSGAILAPAAVIGENLIKPLFPKTSDKQLLLIIRISVVLVTFFSIWMALSRQDIFTLVGESSAFSLVSLFIPMTAGLYWKKANLTGCIASMFFGFFTWLLCNFYLYTEVPPILYGLLAGGIALFLGSFFPDKLNSSKFSANQSV
ncbi:transporter, SSS family [Pseudarcicella hirudinis]|uniref:Transporter, SSS family n=1 Tax=Pseudarcicella hirudinis TaxID=1079859 RepID=A0A1I5UI53_9BACT|nr:sodium:solute symporter family protein [Pseudarcicella hirudinis]SFP94727.1 transporter, SSS family [Pseudarcicella hirudinis]